MVIRIQLTGSKQVHQFLLKLPSSLNKEINRSSEQFMKAVQKSAKLRAPRRTGKLAESIRVEKLRKNSWILIVDSPYGAFQELGFTPHWVHAWMPTGMGGETIGDVLNIAGFARVAKSTPFVQPALEANIARLPSILNRGVVRGIQRAGG